MFVACTKCGFVRFLVGSPVRKVAVAYDVFGSYGP